MYTYENNYRYEFHYIQNGKLVVKKSSLSTKVAINHFYASLYCEQFEIDNQRPRGTVSMYSVKDNAYLLLSNPVSDFIKGKL